VAALNKEELYKVIYITSFNALDFSILLSLYLFFVFLLRTTISLANINYLLFARKNWCVCGEGNILLCTS
jgi:hypothetical protein